jgi:hypothetical protein
MKNPNLQIIIPRWEKDNTITVQEIPSWYYVRNVKVTELDNKFAI